MKRQCFVVSCPSPPSPAVPPGHRCVVSWSLLALLAPRLAAGADDGPERGALPSLVLRVEGAGCPDAALVESQLEPLLPARTLVTEPVGDDVAEVRDLGLRYEVLVAGEARVLEDPHRDCLERARAAALVIALGARRGAVQDRPTADELLPAQAAMPEEGAPKELDSAMRFQLLGLLEHATDVPVVPGASLGVALSSSSWRPALALGFLGPVTIDDPRGSGGGFRLLRLPVTLTGSYLRELGAFHLGPGLGVVLEGVRLQGVDTPEPTGGWRWNVGALASFVGHLSLGAGWGAFLGVRGTVFARTYEAWVEPDRSLGSTPRWWLGSFLGLERALGQTTGAP